MAGRVSCHGKAMRAFLALSLMGTAAAAHAEGLGGLWSFLGRSEPETTGSLKQPSLRSSDLQPVSSAELARIKKALAAYKSGDLGAGDATAQGIQDPVAATLVEWLAIRGAGQQMGFDRLAAFVERHPDWPTQGNLRRRAEEALVAEKRPAATVRAFFAKSKPVTPGGKLALADALRESGQAAQASELVRQAWTRDLFGRELEARFLASYGAALTKADHHRRAEAAVFTENFEAAQRAAALVGPDFVAVTRAAIAAGEKSERTGAAIAAIPPTLKTEPLAIYARVQHLRRSEKYQEAAEALSALPHAVEARDGDLWWVERRMLSRKLLDDGVATTALRVARDHAAESAAQKVDAEFLSGWIALRVLKDNAAAQHHFARAAQAATTPISTARATYWQARAAEASGMAAGSFYQRAASFSTTYYGQLARARLGLRDLPLQTGAQGSVAAVTRLASVRAVAMLYAAEEPESALPLIADLAQTLPDAGSLDALADIAAAYGDARAVLVVGKAATQRGFSLPQHAFPVFGIPKQALADSPIEKPFVYAITRQESAFDYRAVSSAGARGLMQLTPGTAKLQATKVGIGFDAARLHKPSYNVTLGASHLGDLVETWGGSYILAIASYNAGPGNVKKWIAAYGDPRNADVDPVDWVERIPFSETRNYVQRVLENLQVYRGRLGEPSAVLIDSDLKRGSR
jgi:soluble lytic murein transglycosylase